MTPQPLIQQPLRMDGGNLALNRGFRDNGRQPPPSEK